MEAKRPNTKVALYKTHHARVALSEMHHATRHPDWPHQMGRTPVMDEGAPTRGVYPESFRRAQTSPTLYRKALAQGTGQQASVKENFRRRSMRKRGKGNSTRQGMRFYGIQPRISRLKHARLCLFFVPNGVVFFQTLVSFGG